MRTFSGAALQACVIGAAVFGSVALMSGPEAKAACISSDNVCTTFDPSTSSSPSNIGGFSGTVNVAVDYVQAGVNFRYTGSPSSITLTGISLIGDGISTPLSWASVNVASGDPGTGFTGFLNIASTSGSAINFANNRISFTIPAGVANGSTIEAEVIYFSSISNVNSSQFDFKTTSNDASPVPGPVTLLGAGAAFGFSRKIRRRISSSS